MSRYLATVGLLALIAQGCTKKPESYPLTSFRVDYQTWNCQQLADDLTSVGHPTCTDECPLSGVKRT